MIASGCGVHAVKLATDAKCQSEKLIGHLVPRGCQAHPVLDRDTCVYAGASIYFVIQILTFSQAFTVHE